MPGVPLRSPPCPRRLHGRIAGLAQERRAPLGPLHIPTVHRRRHFQHHPDLRRLGRGGKASSQDQVGEQHLGQFPFLSPLPQGLGQPPDVDWLHLL